MTEPQETATEQLLISTAVADGGLAAPGETVFGRVDRTGWTAMLFFSWENSDLPPETQQR